MILRNKVILKLSCIVFMGLYFYSFLWISFMYLLGFMYMPIRDRALREYLPFEYMSLFIVSIGLLLILFKTKGTRFYHILFQDIGIVILAIPFFSILLGLIKMGWDDGNSKAPLVLVVVLTMLLVNYNDYRKLSRK